MKKRNHILISAVICTLIMIFVDGIVKPPYMVKSFIKIIVFGGNVLTYACLHKDKLPLFRSEKRSLIKTLMLSAGVYAVIIAGYLLTKNFIDYSNITDTLTSDIGVSKENFLYVSLYISFVNSLLEEIFFRGYCYLTLRKYTGNKFGCIFSAVLFAVYHGGMLDGWFNAAAYIFMIAALFMAGLFFNMLDNKQDSVLPSWLPHMFANFGINTVGFILFGA